MGLAKYSWGEMLKWLIELCPEELEPVEPMEVLKGGGVRM